MSHAVREESNAIFEVYESLSLFLVGHDEASEVVGDELGEAIATGLPKNLVSCTSVESSSPGIVSSLGDLILLTNLRTVLRIL